MEEKMSEISDAAISAAEETIITQTSTFIHWVKSLLTWENLFKVIGAVIILLAMWIIYKIILRSIKKVPLEKTNEHKQQIAVKFVKYIFYISVVVYVLGLFGVKLSAIWGAAGIAGVAIGFAAQTSVSNLISGIFVITDKAMKPGDFIEVDGVSGNVDSVGIISVKIRTLDNQIIRVPNSTIINSKLINYSTLKYRRYVFEVSVDYGTDLDKAVAVLKTVPSMCPTVITDNPDYAPNAFCTTLGDSGINMNLVVWSLRENFLQTKGDVCINTVKAFNEAKINIPFNRMDVTLLTEETNPPVSKNA